MMEAPVYKLEQVVHNKGGREDFEGPLDLILFLLSKNKIEIQDIPIALILEQYLAYLEQRQQMDLEVAAAVRTTPRSRPSWSPWALWRPWAGTSS